MKKDYRYYTLDRVFEMIENPKEYGYEKFYIDLSTRKVVLERSTNSERVYFGSKDMRTIDGWGIGTIKSWDYRGMWQFHEFYRPDKNSYKSEYYDMGTGACVVIDKSDHYYIFERDTPSLYLTEKIGYVNEKPITDAYIIQVLEAILRSPHSGELNLSGRRLNHTMLELLYQIKENKPTFKLKHDQEAELEKTFALMRNYKNLQEQHAVLRTEANELRTRKTELTNSLNQSENNVRTLTGSNETLTTRFQRVEEELRLARAESVETINRLREESNISITTLRNELTTENNRLNGELGTAHTEISILSAHIETLIAEHHDEIKKLELSHQAEIATIKKEAKATSAITVAEKQAYFKNQYELAIEKFAFNNTPIDQAIGEATFLHQLLVERLLVERTEKNREEFSMLSVAHLNPNQHEINNLNDQGLITTILELFKQIFSMDISITEDLKLKRLIEGVKKIKQYFSKKQLSDQQLQKLYTLSYPTFNEQLKEAEKSELETPFNETATLMLDVLKNAWLENFLTQENPTMPEAIYKQHLQYATNIFNELKIFKKYHNYLENFKEVNQLIFSAPSEANKNTHNQVIKLFRHELNSINFPSLDGHHKTIFSMLLPLTSNSVIDLSKEEYTILMKQLDENTITLCDEALQQCGFVIENKQDKKFEDFEATQEEIREELNPSDADSIISEDISLSEDEEKENLDYLKMSRNDQSFLVNLGKSVKVAQQNPVEYFSSPH